MRVLNFFLYVYIFIQNYPFTTGTPADGVPASASNIYDTNKYVLCTKQMFLFTFNPRQ